MDFFIEDGPSQAPIVEPCSDRAGRYMVLSRRSVHVCRGDVDKDFAIHASNGTLVFELAELPRAAVVVEDRYGNLLKHAYAPAGFLPDMLARVQVRYPEIPILFLETRALAEEWTFRYLGAALAGHALDRAGELRGARAAERPADYGRSDRA